MANSRVHRERRIAALAALRLPLDDIAQEVGLTVRTVQRTISRPEILDLIETFRKQMSSASSGDVLKDLEADTVNSFHRLRELRDQDDDRKVALGATRELWDRQVPKRTTHDETHITKIIIERRDLDRMRLVREEMKQITDAAYEEVHGTPAPDHAASESGDSIAHDSI